MYKKYLVPSGLLVKPVEMIEKADYRMFRTTALQDMACKWCFFEGCVKFNGLQDNLT